MARRLSAEERELWERVRRTLRPLRPASHEPQAEPPAALPVSAGDKAAGKAAAAALPRSRPAEPNGVPPLAFEERDKRRLARGLTAVDARLDFHGMGQERAFNALTAFLRHSQARGARIVLVITGKGRQGEEGRGVLRRAVPAWLARPELRDLVVGFSEAARRHGGAGALYVRLRRRSSRRASER